nr:MAG TPA: hypothetical protein [Caudoviricetes sp.]
MGLRRSDGGILGRKLCHRSFATLIFGIRKSLQIN